MKTILTIVATFIATAYLCISMHDAFIYETELEHKASVSSHLSEIESLRFTVSQMEDKVTQLQTEKEDLTRTLDQKREESQYFYFRLDDELQRCKAK